MKKAIRPHRIALLATLPVLLLAAASPAPRAVDEEEPSVAEKVEAYARAFDARDLDALLALTHEDVEWSSLTGDRVAVETRGREALRASLEAYFRACPSCSASLEWVEGAGSRVAALEHASYDTAEGRRTQQSLSVYEFEDGLVRRVIYFPSEPVPPEAGRDD